MKRTIAAAVLAVLAVVTLAPTASAATLSRHQRHLAHMRHVQVVYGPKAQAVAGVSIPKGFPLWWLAAGYYLSADGSPWCVPDDAWSAYFHRPVQALGTGCAAISTMALVDVPHVSAWKVSVVTSIEPNYTVRLVRYVAAP